MVEESFSIQFNVLYLHTRADPVSSCVYMYIYTYIYIYIYIYIGRFL